MVTDDEMLQQGLEFVREAGNEREFGLQHLQFNHHVAEQLAAGSIGKRAIVNQFVNLADVVEKNAGQQ